MAADSAHHIVIVGAGFGGLEVARYLAGTNVRITVIDGRNHHLFQPLLYQVATASLATSEIAWPIRSLLRRYRNVTTLLAKVVGVNSQDQMVLLEDGATIAFDTLVLATGARHAYFGHDEWEPFAPGLKTIEDATAIPAIGGLLSEARGARGEARLNVPLPAGGTATILIGRDFLLDPELADRIATLPGVRSAEVAIAPPQRLALVG